MQAPHVRSHLHGSRHTVARPHLCHCCHRLAGYGGCCFRGGGVRLHKLHHLRHIPPEPLPGIRAVVLRPSHEYPRIHQHPQPCAGSRCRHLHITSCGLGVSRDWSGDAQAIIISAICMKWAYQSMRLASPTCQLLSTAPMPPEDTPASSTSVAFPSPCRSVSTDSAD